MVKQKKQKLSKQQLPTRSKELPSNLGLDDFILTISDTEDNVPVLDELEDEDALESAVNAAEKAAAGSPEPDVKKGKKRKANAITKSAKKTRLVGNSGVESEEEEDIASDFEFGGVEEGTVGAFDGWELDTATGMNANKSGVDIDEIIRRRRHQRGEKVDDSDDEDEEEDEKLSKRKSPKGNGKNKAIVVEEEDEDDEGADGPAYDSDDSDIAADGFGGAAGSDDEEDAVVKIHGSDSESSEDEGDDDDDDEGDDAGSESDASVVDHPLDEGAYGSDSDAESIDEDEAEAARRAAFFAPESETTIALASKTGKTSQDSSATSSFQSMNLSRPILRGLNAVGFTSPTLIQEKTIPFALLGKDVVGGAVTGSGKTGAFIVPILERLLYRPKKIPTSRVLVLCPTRELAMQCHAVAVKLAQFTDIRFALAIGGLNLKAQEAELRARPDVIIATPGRFIDHMRNTAGVTVDSIEILVMDEADRMLEDGFADELNEIISSIPTSRQTMLFSATMTDSVDQLIRLSLNRPVRLMIDTKNSTVSTLVQEFIRIRPNREHMRLAMLLDLCKNVYRKRCIIFFRSKALAHKTRIMFGLMNLKAAELHGSLSQEQRVKSVELFRTSQVDFLLATDLASRGLDIKNVDTVINFESPQSHEIYLHRVGRTARAGRSGRACTLAAESDRKIVKAAVKSARTQGSTIAARVLSADAVDKLHKKCEKLEPEIAEILAEEKEEKGLGQVDMQIRKGENMMRYADEINARPQRSWFQSQADKKKAQDEMVRKLNSQNAIDASAGADLLAIEKRREKLSGKKKKRLDGTKDREEGRVFKKSTVQRIEGQKRGSGVKTLMKKVKTKAEKGRTEKRAVRKNQIKKQGKRAKKNGTF
ncbi:P-loop containing nucleoside triphosphate hydrolase protein [Peziza echinospora]|nr:P-loop containing nucleoside triphosphate hydrolase protein [Peziza echinospora]